MNRGARRESGSAVLLAALGAVALTVGALAPAVASSSAAGATANGTALPGHIVLPQAVPHVPAGSTQYGAPPAGQVLHLDAVLAGQDPAGLAQAVAAVSTPGSPDYRHYLGAAQYAAQYGPTAAEVAQVSSALRGEGLTVGTPEPGSTLLPVSGTASVVSAALGTPLESVQAPGQSARAIVNTASPQVPASLDGAVTGVVGLDGLFQEHDMLQRGRTTAAAATAPGTTESPEAEARGRAGHRFGRPRRHPPGLRRRPGRGVQRDLHLDTAQLGLRARPALRAGTHRDRAVHRRRGVRAVRGQRLRRLRSVLRVVQPDPQRAGRRRRRRTGPGRRRGRARYRTGRLQRPLRLPRRLRGAQRRRRAGVRPLQPDRQRRQLTGRDDELGRVRGEHAGRRPPDGERHPPAHGAPGPDGDRGVG